MADIQLLLEAERRGLLPPDKVALLTEARNRGLIEKTSSQSKQPDATQYDAVTQTPVASVGLTGTQLGIQPRSESELLGGNYLTDLVANADKIGNTIRKGISKPLGYMAPLIESKLPNQQDMVDLAAGASGLMRSGAKKLGLGEGIWPEGGANKSSGYRTIGELADPVALAIGGGIAKAIPVAQMFGRGAGKAMQAMGQNAASGAITGGLVGGLSEGGDAATGAATGGALMAGIPVVGKLAKFGGGILDDISKTVVSAMGGKQATNKLAEDALIRSVPESQKAQVIDALLKERAKVAGSNITAGQSIAGSQVGKPTVYGSNLVKLQNELKSMPQTEDILSSAVKQQKLARSNAIGTDLAGGLDDAARAKALSDAEQRVGEVSKANYGNAFASDAQRIEAEKAAQIAKARQSNYGAIDYKPSIDPRIQSMGNDSVFNSAVKSASSRMNGQDPRTSLEGLHMIKQEIDNLYKSDKFSERAISESKARLLSAIEGADNAPGISPLYKQARTTHAEMMPEVNRLKIGQALLNKLESGAGAERPGVFLSSVGEGEDAFLRNKAGQMRGKSIEEHLLPEQLKTVKNVEQELVRDAEMKRIVGDTSGSTGLTQKEEIPTLLNRAAMATNFVLGLAKQGAKDKVALEVSKKLTDPKAVAEVLMRPKSDPVRKVIEAMTSQNRVAAIVANKKEER